MSKWLNRDTEERDGEGREEGGNERVEMKERDGNGGKGWE
jgi:hypothetical protein